MVVQVARFVPTRQIVGLRRVCRLWCKVGGGDALWWPLLRAELSSSGDDGGDLVAAAMEESTRRARSRFAAWHKPRSPMWIWLNSKYLQQALAKSKLGLLEAWLLTPDDPLYGPLLALPDKGSFGVSEVGVSERPALTSDE